MTFTFHDLELVACTIYGEARGESFIGKMAVGFVILNRAKKRGTTPGSEAIRPYQFSCWNKDDPNCKLITNPNDISGKEWRECFRAALQVLGGFDLVGCKVDDLTKGATHYHTQSIKPYWAQGKEPCYVVGNHIFYNNID